MTRNIFILVVLLLQGIPATVFAQSLASDRLPSLVRSNSFLAGQALGCVVRYEVYASESLTKLYNVGAPVPPQMADLNAFFGVEIETLRQDLVSALSSLAQSALDTETQIAAVKGMSLLELNATELPAGMYPAWMQVAGCMTLLRQVGISEAYPA